MIHLTKSQRLSLFGQIKWVNLETGTFYIPFSGLMFLKRIKAVDQPYQLNDAGLTYMANWQHVLPRA